MSSGERDSDGGSEGKDIAKRKKRTQEDDEGRGSRRKISRFVDIEAGVGSDEEDEGEEDFGFLKDEGASEVEENPSLTEIRSVEREMERIRAIRFEQQNKLLSTRFDPEEEERRIRERYGPKKGIIGAKELGTQGLHTGLIPQRNTDPKLWLVKCKIGREIEASLALMHVLTDKGIQGTNASRADSDNGTGVQHKGVSSIIYRDQLRGFLYVEAYRPADIVQFIHNAHLGNLIFTNLSTAMPTLVPYSEMVEVLMGASEALRNINGSTSRHILPKVDSWVRIRRGKHANDLALVIGSDPLQGLVTIKLVPRLLIPEPGESKQAIESLKRAGKLPQRLFNPKQAALIGVVRKTRGLWQFCGENFAKDGFLLKVVRPTSLIVENILPPKAAETQPFRKAGLLENIIPTYNTTIEQQLINTGERVKIKRGEMIGLVGTVVGIRPGKMTENIKDATATTDGKIYLVTLDDKSLDYDQVELKQADIEKYFAIGDQVFFFKNRDGTKTKYSDSVSSLEKLAGIIVSIDEASGEAFVFAPLLETQLTIQLNQLFASHGAQDASTPSFSGEPDSCPNISINDLVRWVPKARAEGGSNEVFGVVMTINESSDSSVCIIDQFGNIRNLPILEIQTIAHQKPQHRNGPTRPSEIAITSEFAPGTSVSLRLDEIGQQKGDMQVLASHFDHVFCRDTLSGKISVYPRSSLIRREPSIPFHGGNLSTLPRRSLPRLLGKTVKICSGPHKGYIGTVKQLTESLARVELQSNCKVISINPKMLVSVGLDQEKAQHSAIEGTRTPAHIAATRTPAWTSTRTPAWNSALAKTPSWTNPSDKTPSWAHPNG